MAFFAGLTLALAVLLVALAAIHGGLQFPHIGTVSRTLPAIAPPTKTPTATPVVGSIYLNALAVPTSGWTIDKQCQFLSDGYHDDCADGAKNTAVACYGPVRVQDAVIVVDTKLIAGPLDFGYGIVFRSDTNHSEYGFLISPDGHWTTYKLVKNQLTPIVNWTATSHVHKTKGVHNLLAVYIKGAHMNFFVNGVLGGQADDDTFRGSGAIGLTASAGQNVVFANFSVSSA